MKVVILLHKQHIGGNQDNAHRHKVNPMRQNGIRHQINHAQGNGKLQPHIDEAHSYVVHSQFVSHKLIGVFAVSLAKILVEHDAVKDGAAAVDAVDNEECEPGDIGLLHNKLADEEEQDESDSNAADVPGEAFGLVLRPKVEDAENQHGKDGDDDEALVCQVHQRQRHQHRKRVRRRDAVDSIHEIVDVGGAYAHDEPRHNEQRPRPPCRQKVPMADCKLVQHKPHSQKLHNQAHAVRKRMDVVNETDSRRQRDGREEPGVLEAIKSAPYPKADGEDYPAAPEHNPGVGTALVGFVDDVEMIRHAEVQKFCRQENGRNNKICNHIYCLISLNACSISLSGTIPPHMRYTYSGVMQPGSMEQERASDSRKSSKRVVTSFVIVLPLYQRNASIRY